MVGAGAIGGYMAVRIAAAGHEVSVVARGPHLAAIKSNGMKLVEGDQETICADLIATDKINELSSQDLVSSYKLPRGPVDEGVCGRGRCDRWLHGSADSGCGA